MIDDIKETVNSFAAQHENELTTRDVAGLNKIQFELDLLKERFARPKAKAKRPLIEDLKPED